MYTTFFQLMMIKFYCPYLSSGATSNIVLTLTMRYVALQAREKKRKWPHCVSVRIFASCNMKKCCCNTAAKSNRFDFAAVLQQQKYVSATNFRMISTWPMVCNTYSAKKNRNMMIIIIMLFVIMFKEIVRNV